MRPLPDVWKEGRMSDAAFQLGVEELAYAMGVIAGSESAAQYLGGLLGDRPPGELQGRLLAAGHSLVARGLLDFDLESAAKRLHPAFEPLVAALIHTDFSLSLLCRTRAGTRRAALHSGAGVFVEHKVERSVVSRVEAIPGAEAARARVLAFFGLDAAPAGEPPPAAAATLPATILNELGASARALPLADAQVLLAGVGVPGEVAAAFAEDVAHSTMRGSLLRMAVAQHAGGDGAANGSAPEVEVQEGILLLSGAARAWLVELAQPDPAQARLFAYHPAALRRMLERLGL